MKQKNKSLFWVFLALCTFGLYAPVQAQDDLYYDPATDAPAPTASSNSDDSDYREPSNITRRYDEDGYSDEDDDYAYEYSSRIRRFHRPAPAVDYYDPFFSDLYYYDPYFMPGNSIYTYGYNDYWSWRQWRRAQRWNSWYSWGVGPTWSTWGWNSCYNAYNPWNNPWAMNNYYYDPYWTWNGYNPYYGNYGYGNNWNDNSYYYSNTGNGSNFQPKTYTGVRRHGSSVNSGYARIAETNGGMGRLVDSKQTGPVLQTRNAPRSSGLTKGTGINGTGPSSGRTVEAREETTTGRRPNDRANTPNNNDRNVEQPARTRPSSETAPRRSESPAETRPSRQNETETRPTRTQSETRPSRTEERPRSESRPARTEERTRSNDTPSRTQESRPSRSEGRSNDNGSSNNRSYDSGSSRSSSGSSGNSSSGSSSGSGSSGGSSGGGGSRGRN